MSTHDDDTCPHLVRANLLEAENARLKSLCDMLGMGGKHTITAIDSENARLKAEVEGLKAEKDQLECDYDNCYKRLIRIDDARYDLFMEVDSLKAQVERLTKAGDQMAAVILQYRCSPWGRKVPTAFTVWQAWFDAKEGKQP